MNQLPPFSVVFRRDLLHGRCAAVTLPSLGDGARIPDAALAALVEGERDFALTLAPARRASFVGGRIALRAALADLGVVPGPILKDDHGAPTLPLEVTGSISHKRDFAVALAKIRNGAEVAVGVDLEVLESRPIDIGPRVLTETERLALTGLPEPERRRQALLAFSLKEALYKAAAPFVGRVIGFTEAEIPMPIAEGSSITPIPLRLKVLDNAMRLEPEGAFFRWDDRVISTSCVFLVKD